MFFLKWMVSGRFRPVSGGNLLFVFSLAFSAAGNPRSHICSSRLDGPFDRPPVGVSFQEDPSGWASLLGLPA